MDLEERGQLVFIKYKYGTPGAGVLHHGAFVPHVLLDDDLRGSCFDVVEKLPPHPLLEGGPGHGPGPGRAPCRRSGS
eukprot:6278055-Heterocapsa_arctica.AAC.1